MTIFDEKSESKTVTAKERAVFESPGA